MPFLFLASRVPGRKDHAPAGRDENASLVLAFALRVGLHKHTSSLTGLIYKFMRNKPFRSVPVSNLVAPSRHVSHRSAIALNSPERFRAGSLNVIHSNRVGLTVLLHFDPTTAEIRASFCRNVNVMFPFFRGRWISRNRAILEIKIQLDRSCFSERVLY